MNRFILITTLVVFSACNRSPHDDQPEQANSREHAGESVQHTLYSEQYEYFIEHPPLAAGEEAEFLIHMTELKDYRACSSGEVSISMDGVTFTSDQPESPGIFHVDVIPPGDGEFNAVFIYSNGKMSQSADQPVIVMKENEAITAGEEEEEGHEHEESSTGEITFLKEQAWKSDFMVSRITPSTFHAVIPTSGELIAMPGEKQNITAGSQGIIRFANPHLVQGTLVKKGQLLFTLSSETLLEDNVKLRYEEARNALEKSRSEYRRHLTLYEQNAISERQFQNSRTAFHEDSLRYYSLAANVSEGGVRVTAPVSGTIHELFVSDGEYTEPGRLLATLSNNLNLVLRADLPQQFFGKLGEIHSANFRPAYSDRVFSLQEMNGRLLASGVSVAENNHYLPVIFQLENNGNLLEGAFAEVYLQGKEKNTVLVVPVSALLEEQGTHYLYVQVSGESYTKRVVVTGDSDGLNVEISSGLDAGERVVTRGPMLVKAASMAGGVMGDGHSH